MEGMDLSRQLAKAKRDRAAMERREKFPDPSVGGHLLRLSRIPAVEAVEERLVAAAKDRTDSSLHVDGQQAKKLVEIRKHLVGQD